MYFCHFSAIFDLFLLFLGLAGIAILLLFHRHSKLLCLPWSCFDFDSLNKKFGCHTLYFRVLLLLMLSHYRLMYIRFQKDETQKKY